MEVYGEKPRVFTKEWWPYFWDYYKWHTIISTVTIATIIFSVASCISVVKPDVTISYVNYYPITTDGQKRIEDDLSVFVPDINRDNKKTLRMLQLRVPIPGTPENLTQEAGALDQRISAEFAAGDSYLFLITKERVFTLIKQNMLFSIDEYANGLPRERLVYDNNGKVCAILIKGSKLFEDNTMKTDDVYAVIRKKRYNEKHNIDNESFEESKKILKQIADGIK